MELTEINLCTRLALMGQREEAILASRATSALTAVLRALKLPSGSEVLMPATLCANPALAVRLAGLRPLFADVSPADLNLDLEAARRVIGPQTRVLLAVPIFGHPLAAPAFETFAAERGLVLIEDAAHAVGLYHSDRPAGALGFCSIFSFGRGKIAAAGGGAAILGQGSFLRRVQVELDRLEKSSRYSTVQILAALDQLPEELEIRAAAVRRYSQGHGLPEPAAITHLQPLRTGDPLWLYSMLLPDRESRDRTTRDLLSKGIEATNLYPPLPLFFRDSRAPQLSNYPVAWNAFNRIVNLPLLDVSKQPADF